MAQYIDKSALVAEIEKRRDSFYSLSELCEKGTPAKAGFYAQAQTLEGILSFLDTLEVKEVDLESLLHPSKVNNNLFKEVYFGKPYKTRDGRKALYCYQFNNSHALIIEGDEEFWYVRDDGLVDDFDDSFMDSSYYTDKDIISEW